MSVRSKHEIVIIGAGGFGAVAASVIDSMNAVAVREKVGAPWNLLGYVDGDPRKGGTQHADRAVLGTIEEVGHDFRDREVWFFCAIGDNQARARLAQRAESLGWKPATLVHPSAIVDRTAEIGPGSCVAPAVVLSYKTRIGAHVVIDSHVSVGHDTTLMDFCEVFAGARINGNCHIGEYVVVGCNATLLPGSWVGDRAVVGANSLAHGTVEPDTTVFGIPARTIRRNTCSAVAQRKIEADEVLYVKGDLRHSH
jgi:sugar O-acyltransferase (sialic acid O-acetyltransferase NeuD family)